MDFQERYRKHKTFIENRWQPIDVKVILEEDREKKISIIREAKKRAANEIQDQDELHSFLEFLEGQLSWNQTSLNKEGSASTSQVDALLKCIKGERTALGLPNHIVGMSTFGSVVEGV